MEKNQIIFVYLKIKTKWTLCFFPRHSELSHVLTNWTFNIWNQGLRIEPVYCLTELRNREVKKWVVASNTNKYFCEKIFSQIYCFSFLSLLEEKSWKKVFQKVKCHSINSLQKWKELKLRYCCMHYYKSRSLENRYV